MAKCKLKKGDRVYRKNLYEVGYDAVETVLPPFDSSKDEVLDRSIFISGLTFGSDERGITCQVHPLLEK